HLLADPVDIGRAKPPRRIAMTRTAPVNEVLGRDVFEFAAATPGIVIALIGHFIIHDWHGLIIARIDEHGHNSPKNCL
ncbi:hypothetical protein LIR44_22675, partial [Bacteroides fragilis]